MYKGWGQSSVTGQRERSNICLLDVREHLHWWVEESLPPLSNQERRRTAEKDIRPPPPPPPPPPTPDLSRQQPAHTHTAHGLHENILNSIRICKFHELAVLLLNILSGCQINLGCNVWHSEPLFKTETNFSPTNLFLSHSRSDLPVSSPQNLIILEIWGENVTPQDCLLSSGTWREIEKKKRRESLQPCQQLCEALLTVYCIHMLLRSSPHFLSWEVVLPTTVFSGATWSLQGRHVVL